MGQRHEQRHRGERAAGDGAGEAQCGKSRHMDGRKGTTTGKVRAKLWEVLNAVRRNEDFLGRWEPQWILGEGRV